LNTVEIDSLIRLAQIALAAPDVLPLHKRSVLNSCLWFITEIGGKYTGPRYWSEGVKMLVDHHGSIENVIRDRVPIRHEHVYPRKELIDKMMKDPACVEKVLREQAIACIVTHDEHRRLRNTRQGFERYRAANIRVWDRVNAAWVD
jgi:hypothetical protein